MKYIITKKSTILFFLFFNIINLHAQTNNEIWKLIENKNRAEARKILEKKLNNKSYTIDDFVTFQLLEEFNGKNLDFKNVYKLISQNDNPYPYIFALWDSESFVGSYGIKSTQQYNLIDELINQNPGNGSLRAASHYVHGFHLLKKNQISEFRNEFMKMGSISNWQFVGPFNNISGSGFNKNYDPINDPSNNTIFLSKNNAPIKWFTPEVPSNEGWININNFISTGDAGIVYAQTFVNSPNECDVYLCSGFAGNIKIWVNDKLVISEQEESITELDSYNAFCHLNKGENRIVVQSGRDEIDNHNFIVRITDDKYEPYPGLTFDSKPKEYKKNKSTNSEVKIIPHFAEEFFKNKIKIEPNNITNYILLNKVYIRNRKLFEARKILEQGLKLYQNAILKVELGLCYIKENNQVGLSEITEYIKEEEKESIIYYDLLINDLKSEKKNQELLDTINSKIKIFGESESTFSELINVNIALNDVPKLIKLVEEAHRKYPNSELFANYMYNIYKNVEKDINVATGFMENYLSNHYSFGLKKLLISDYFQNNNSRKAYNKLKENIEIFPFDPEPKLALLKEYITQQKYNEGYELIKSALKQKPYSGYLYRDKASIEESMNKTQDAINSYNLALKYDPNMYESREKLRNLQKKKNLSKEVEKYKIDDLIKNTGKNIKKDDDDYYYILDDTNIYLHPEGAKEVVHTVVLKILNQRGIDRYKETTLSYNSSEELIIEESQLIKSNGKKTNPEVNQNEVIWTGLEVNDIIYVKYRLKSYLYGKFAKEFYDSFVFTNDIPTEISRYTLILPKDKPIFYKTLNGVLEPAISEFEDYKYYQWELINSKVIKDEPFMPPFSDIGLSLHLSTMKDWSEIAEWYSDLVYSKISDNNDYVVQEVYSKIFNDKKNLNSSEKAKLIYDYIVENISYSSVSFRQSGIIPQKASKTINTRLGDCKDISTLFVSLANLCGLKANLVLVSTRENGLKGMNLPSFNFNHCIVKYFDENQNENYLELTDRDLPFKSLPIGLYQALSLTIPSKNENSQKSDLVNLTNSNKLVDKSKCLTSLNIDGNEMQISRSLVKYGNGVSNTRNTYKSMSSENITKKMQEEVSSRFSNPIKLKKVDILGIDKLVDSVVINQEFSVTNEVKKIGNLFAFSIPFQEQIFNSTAINIPVRNYDFEYWNYENIDEYENEIVVNLPNERSFVDIPSNETFNFNNINYSISYTKVSKNKLVIKRNAQINRNNIKATDYNNFKTFVSKILEVEGAYLTFK